MSIYVRTKTWIENAEQDLLFGKGKTEILEIGDVVPKGSIFVDFHFPYANSNLLLGTSLDPVTKTPDYKVWAVRLESL